MRTRLATLATALTLSVSTALADPADPFATGDLTATSQAASINKPIMLSPCGFSNTDKAPLSLPDIVERALCNNPQTREAWANARAQAAQVGVSGRPICHPSTPPAR